MILSKIGGYYALIVPFLAFVLSSDKAFVKDLVRKIKQISGQEGRQNEELQVDISNRLSFVGLFQLYSTVEENNVKFEKVAKGMMMDIKLSDTRLETVEDLV